MSCNGEMDWTWRMATPDAICRRGCERSVYHRRLTHLRSTTAKDIPQSRLGSVRKPTQIVLIGLFNSPKPPANKAHINRNVRFIVFVTS